MGNTNISVRPYQEGHDQNTCRMTADILARIGDKWTVMIVGVLGDGPMRYNQIHRTIDGISQRMLTLTLRGLEQDGLVNRTMYPTIPPKVEYELTPLGRELIGPLKTLFQWAQTHGPAMTAAREAYAEREREGTTGLAGFNNPK